MTGHNVFQQMINENNHTELTRNPITQEDFELWKKDYLGCLAWHTLWSKFLQ